MKCPACGSEEIVEFHGHEACVCGRMLDGDCCQGAPIKCETSETKSGPDKASSKLVVPSELP